MDIRPIGIFDSGIGGVTVLNELMRLMPREDFVYLADFRYCPYGGREERFIKERSRACLDILLAENVKLCVIACNTATNAAAELLRKESSIPIVGAEPAIKPACEQNRGGKVLVMCTPATAKAEKFRRLISKYRSFDLSVLAEESLAPLIEKNIMDLKAIKGELKELLESYRGAESAVLGCTHYVYVAPEISELLGGAKIYDGNAGIAANVKRILDKDGLSNSKGGSVKFIST